jgi:hypothetical protein
MPEGGWDSLFARLEALGHRGAIVGLHGRGKTTLLEDLAGKLRSRGLRVRSIRIPGGARELSPDQDRALAELAAGELLALDSAGALSSRAWRRVRRAARSGAGLVVTSHRPERLPTLVELRTTPGLLADIVGELAGRELAARLPSAGELFARHAGNLRAALRELYDYCAGRTGGSFPPA